MKSTKSKKVVCKGCGKEPHEIREYVIFAQELDITPEQYVINEEGTYNKRTKLFYCTDCYMKAGMPLGIA